jgi:NADH-quinone oxidoreductase subunit N
MNAIIVSTLLGVIMMFVSWGTNNTKLQRNIGLLGMLVLIFANIAQMNGWLSVNFDTKGMLAFNAIGLYVNTILFVITFIYLWINGEEMDKIGSHTADYYAIFFFILCGVSILTSFDNLLMLFIGIEIVKSGGNTPDSAMCAAVIEKMKEE